MWIHLCQVILQMLVELLVLEGRVLGGQKSGMLISSPSGIQLIGVLLPCQDMLC